MKNSQKGQMNGPNTQKKRELDDNSNARCGKMKTFHLEMNVFVFLMFPSF